MKRRLLRRLSVLLGWMLGFSGCEDLVAPEYGVPHAAVDLDGKVVVAGTTNGISGIEGRRTFPTRLNMYYGTTLECG